MWKVESEQTDSQAGLAKCMIAAFADEQFAISASLSIIMVVGMNMGVVIDCFMTTVYLDMWLRQMYELENCENPCPGNK